MSDVTEILRSIEAGHAQAAERLLALVYQELRRMAAAQLASERPGQTLDATGLVHEAYLRLVGEDHDLHFVNRKHFFSAAAEAMRRILVENARRKGREKHGGGRQRVALADHAARIADEDVIALDVALRELALEDAVAAKVVELRQFVGLGHEQVAQTLEITVYQARQKWTYARAWLRSALRE